MAGQIINRGKNVWLVRVFRGRDQNGKRQYSNTTVHGTKKDAEARLTDELRLKDLGESAPSLTTVQQFLETLHADYKINGKSHEWVDGVIRKHLGPFFGSMRVARLRFEAVQRYIQQRQAAEAANATINREIALLRRAFNLAKQSGKWPGALPSFPKKLNENNVRKGFFEHKDFRALRAALPREIVPIATFAYWTGCRKSEILSLQWRQVDLSERIVRFDPGSTKNDDPRVVPLADELYNMLLMQRAARDEHFPSCPWVFFRDGQPIRDFRGAWAKACEAAGLVDDDGEPAALFHDLRRTGVRNLVRAGVPERVAMAISGHRTRAVFDRYNITSEADLREAARKLSAHMAGKEEDRKPQGAQPEKGWHTIGTQAAENDKAKVH